MPIFHFVKLTDGLGAKKKRKIFKTANIVAFVIVLSFILIGKYIFQIFGLTIPAFKVFGRILIFYIGFEMLQSKIFSIQLQVKNKLDDAIAVSPLAIQFLAGPGTIITAMNFVIRANLFRVMITIIIFALIVFLTHLAFIYRSYIVKLVRELCNHWQNYGADFKCIRSKYGDPGNQISV